jgi:hypothetical protein
MSPAERRQLITGSIVIGGIILALLLLFIWPR